MANQRAAKHGRILRTLGISGTALALAACGGGGGGGGSDSGSGISGSTSYTSGTSPAAIDSEGTGTTAAAAAADSVSSSAGTSNLGVSAGSLGSALVAEGGEAGLSLAAAGLAARQLATEAMNRSGNLPAGVTESCNDGGSFSYTGSNSLSVGTPLVLAFDDCYFGSLGFDGSISLTLNAGDFSGNNYDATLEFNHFLIASSGQTVYGANGPIRIRSGSETQVFP
ncbi:MAG TPA: hypothetical protein VKA55_02960, partial [Gammaproteobacteria bacterium]|nr:hypothetical protein [Gammaproteobacteria bacterium]